jgi:hypothetical protein
MPLYLLLTNFPQQEFYLAADEPVWYWGRAHVNNALFKRHLCMLMQSLLHRADAGTLDENLSSNIRENIEKSTTMGQFRLDMERAFALIWRRYTTNGFDSPRRLYRELTSRATNPRDIIYGLRGIFDPVFGRIFAPDCQMRTELLFACLAVFLIQFESWGDVLWWYPTRFQPRKRDYPSWLPDFTERVWLHELDVQPWDKDKKLQAPKLVVPNHRLHAVGYVLDKVHGHRHLDHNNGEMIPEGLWQ